jgi:hypothetical protein
MKIIIVFLLTIYAFFQIRHYLKNGEIKETLTFLFIFTTSVYYLIGYLWDLKFTTPVDWLEELYTPIARLIFST